MDQSSLPFCLSISVCNDLQTEVGIVNRKTFKGWNHVISLWKQTINWNNPKLLCIMSALFFWLVKQSLIFNFYYQYMSKEDISLGYSNQPSNLALRETHWVNPICLICLPIKNITVYYKMTFMKSGFLSTLEVQAND